MKNNCNYLDFTYKCYLNQRFCKLAFEFITEKQFRNSQEPSTPKYLAGSHVTSETFT